MFPIDIINRSSTLRESTDPECPRYEKFHILKMSTCVSLMPVHAKQVAEAVSAYFGDTYKIKTFIDATAHIGCDTINFCSRFKATSISLEINPLAYKCLIRNQQTFNTGGYSVLCNCIEFLRGFKQHMDFVYFDPPCSNHLKKKNLMLFLEYEDKAIPIYDVVKSVFNEGFTNTVIIKAPFNFDKSAFEQGLGGVCKFIDIGDVYTVFMIIICTRI